MVLSEKALDHYIREKLSRKATFEKGFPEKWKPLALQFKMEVSDRAKEVDPEQKQNWHSLTLGWALAKGLSPEESYEFSTAVRYKSNLG